MKVDQLLEAKPFDDGLGGPNPDVPDSWFDWIRTYKNTPGEIRPKAWSVKDGNLCCLKTRVLELKNVSDKTLPPFKLGEMGYVIFKKSCAFSDLSWLPVEANRISFTSAKVKSIKGLSKRCEKVEELIISPNTTSGLLEIFRLHGLKDVMTYLSALSAFEDSRFHDAFNIVYNIWKSGGDIFDAQSALLDAGLGKFQ